MTKGNVVGLIDRFSARGFVERRCSATDRRVNLLEISESAHHLVERVLPRQLELISRLVTTLTRRKPTCWRVCSRVSTGDICLSSDLDEGRD